MAAMISRPPPNRCRLVVIAPEGCDGGRLVAALDGGDVASLILPDYRLDEDSFQHFAESIVPSVQENGVAVIIAGSPRIAMRTGADGIHLETDKDDLRTAIEKYQQRLMVGAGGAHNRDDALELGETQPDYIFFGRFGFDTKPEPHPRNLKLGEWWSQMVRIPCVVQAGSDIVSVSTVARTGADFVAVSAAAFADGSDPARAVAEANAELDAHAPAFEG